LLISTAQTKNANTCLHIKSNNLPTQIRSQSPRGQ